MQTTYSKFGQFFQNTFVFCCKENLEGIRLLGVGLRSIGVGQMQPRTRSKISPLFLHIFVKPSKFDILWKEMTVDELARWNLLALPS